MIIISKKPTQYLDTELTNTWKEVYNETTKICLRSISINSGMPEKEREGERGREEEKDRQTSEGPGTTRYRVGRQKGIIKETKGVILSKVL